MCTPCKAQARSDHSARIRPASAFAGTRWRWQHQPRPEPQQQIALNISTVPSKCGADHLVASSAVSSASAAFPIQVAARFRIPTIAGGQPPQPLLHVGISAIRVHIGFPVPARHHIFVGCRKRDSTDVLPESPAALPCAPLAGCTTTTGQNPCISVPPPSIIAE